jgi:alkanesulfonate monooxygenase SsuD/methylene tetrahydromethanopterin reductase-like flavin-dependent oxidoreductase (luciferase family)
MNLEPKIPLYVSGFGPRAMGLAGEYGDGLVFAIPPRGVPVAEALSHARQGASRVDRDLVGFHTAALTSVAVLQPGEAVDSDRIKAALGPNVMASVGYFYDDVQRGRIDPPPFLSRIWKPYCALVEATPPKHRHFRTHEFHYTKLHPGEAELIDAQLIRDTCLVGTPSASANGSPSAGPDNSDHRLCRPPHHLSPQPRIHDTGLACARSIGCRRVQAGRPG